MARRKEHIGRQEESAGYEMSELEARKDRRLRRMEKQKLKKSRTVGKFLVAVQALLTILFLVSLFILKLLPIAYCIAIAAVLILFVLYNYFTQYTKHYRTLGKIFSIILSIILAFGSYYLIKTHDLFSAITGAGYKTSVISVYVLDDSNISSLSQMKDAAFGAQDFTDKSNTDFAIGKITDEIGQEPNVTYYDSFDDLVAALYDGSVSAIILNEAYLDTITEHYESFSDDTRFIASYTNKVKINVNNSSVAVTKESFNIYISGIDVYGNISKTSRSDVNIIATVNPLTKEILLTSTPRDSYVELISDDIPAGNMDKLTHAGIHGVDCSMETLSELYDVPISYYAQINFYGFHTLIDVIGGITVYSDIGFNAAGGKYYFPAGQVELDGEKALAFARERHGVPGGDSTRGKNQMKVITAVVNKLTSGSTIISNYTGIMNSLQGMFQTNVEMDTISDLVKMQLEDMSSWNIKSYAVTGAGSSQITFSMPGKPLYVMIPNEASVNHGQNLIDRVIAGEVLTDADLTVPAN